MPPPVALCWQKKVNEIRSSFQLNLHDDGTWLDQACA
jgi:hypothetical protein